MLGVMAWDFKGEEGNSHGDEKAKFGKKKKNVFWARETMGIRMDSDLRVFPIMPRPHSLQTSLVMALFQGQVLYLHSSGQPRRKVKASS